MLVASEKELKDEYSRIIKKREIQDFKKNWYGTFTIGFEDRNVTLEKFKHHLKISLGIESTDFQVHCLRNEHMVGTSSSMNAWNSAIFNNENSWNELTKIYVSFNLQNNYSKMCELVKLLKTQIKDGTSKLNFINPFYVGINHGKISINSDEYAKISLDKCDLIFREGVYIRSTYLLLSIYKFTNYITNEVFIKILAFDNQKGVEYMIDLDYSDLLEFTEGNVNIINSHKDLANYLSNWVSYFRNSLGEEILVWENKLYFADYTELFGSAEKKSSTDVASQLLLLKHNNRNRLLHSDIETETEMEMNIIHEAFDVQFKQMVYAFNWEITILKGRLSHIITIEFKFSTINVYKLVLYKSVTSPSKKMCSEMIYMNLVPKWTVSAETFGNGDGDLLKVSIFDLKNSINENLVLQRKENSMYTTLINESADLVESEERFNLFKTSYGFNESAIDFSTFKFRRPALHFKGRVLWWRIIQQIKIMRIKQSILDRADFEEFIQTKTRDIYAPTELNYAIVSLYGIPTSNDMFGTINSDKQQRNDSITQNENFSWVKIEITLQTAYESICVSDNKDYSLLLKRNN